MSEKALIARIKESYCRSFEANIEYHMIMAEASKGVGEEIALKRHTLLVNVYKALIEYTDNTQILKKNHDLLVRIEENVRIIKSSIN